MDDDNGGKGKEGTAAAEGMHTRSMHSTTPNVLLLTYLLNRSEYILTSALAIFSCWLLADGGWLPPPPPKKLLMAAWCLCAVCVGRKGGTGAQEGGSGGRAVMRDVGTTKTKPENLGVLAHNHVLWFRLDVPVLVCVRV